MERRLQKNNTVTNEKINEIENVMQSEVLDKYEMFIFNCVTSLTEIEDKRIVSGGWDSNLSISSYDINTKNGKQI